MPKFVQVSISVLDYLKKIYPREATEAEIEMKTRAPACTCGKAIKSLRGRGLVELTGKKGNANLYRYKPAD